jgi:hypothetical protein
MSYQQPPDDPYNQQTRASWPSQPSYPPPPGQPQPGQPQPGQPQGQPQPGQPQQGQQQWYQQPPPQQQNYGSGDAQSAWPQQAPPAAQGGYQAQPATPGYQVQPAQQGYQAPGYQVQAAQPGRGGHRQGSVGGKQYALRGAEVFWYVLGCIDFGAAYFSKIPTKKAACEIFSELQLDGQGSGQGYSLNGAESVWYTLMCIAFGAGYFAKVWAKKALWEMVNMMRAAPPDQVQALARALTGSGAGSAAQYPQRF